MTEENMPTPTIPVHDENFRKTVRDASPVIEKVIGLGYRGSVTQLPQEEVDEIIYQLGLITGQLEAVRARVTNDFDSAAERPN